MTALKEKETLLYEERKKMKIKSYLILLRLVEKPIPNASKGRVMEKVSCTFGKRINWHKPIGKQHFGGTSSCPTTLYKNNCMLKEWMAEHVTYKWRKWFCKKNEEGVFVKHRLCNSSEKLKCTVDIPKIFLSQKIVKMKNQKNTDFSSLPLRNFAHMNKNVQS